jgi:uncharacterized protein YndB with AHSA1/START domain
VGRLDPEQFGRWFGPKGATTTAKAFDLRPGGMLHSFMPTPDGGRMWAKFVYREVEPISRLSWAHSWRRGEGASPLMSWAHQCI